MDNNRSLLAPLLPEKAEVRGSIVSAGVFSRLSFWWLNPLFAQGYKRTLQLPDVPVLETSDQVEKAYGTFAAAWETEQKQKQTQVPSVLRALAECSWQDLVWNGMFAFLRTVMISVGPLILHWFIDYTKSGAAFPFQGPALALLLLFVKLFESLSQRQWNFGSRRIGMRLRASLIAAIYQKQLRLSNASRQSHSMGEILNYASVDAYRIGEFPFWIHQLWTTPLQLILSIAVLFYSVGWATLAGVVVIALAVLANSPLAKLQQKFQSKLMYAQDDRLRATAEALQNMKVLKLQAWELRFQTEIENLRKAEFKWLTAVQFRRSLNATIFWLSPVLVSTATFTACYFLHTPLTPTNVFTSLAALRVVQQPIRIVPDLIAVVIQAQVSLTRISKFLLEDELQPDAVLHESRRKYEYDAVFIQDASLSWDPQSLRPTLRNISVRVPHGHHVAVCGEVGAGKSTLLTAIIGEVPKLAGLIKVSGSLAYVSQTAWIQSGTIQDNILFGLPMDMKRYEETIRVCALDKDIKDFPFGDLTEIGERGVNLSGGQKQRIQMARAIYQDADIYLLDDPFSAVDAHTASSLFKDCIMGALSEKTVVLVTHQVEFLPVFDTILLLQDGEIKQAGQYEELLHPGSTFEELVNAHLETMGTLGNDGNIADSIPFDATKQDKHLSKVKSYDNPKQVNLKAFVAEQLTKEEERETGNTGLKSYIDYLGQNIRLLLFSVAILSHILFVVLQISSNSWMAAKVDDPSTSATKLIVVYAIIGLTGVIFLFFRSFFTVIVGLSASKSFFSALLNSIFHAPMSFFDSTPAGRILSRVSSDLSILDLDLPFMLVITVALIINMLSNLGVLVVVTWQVLIVILPMLYLSWCLQTYYFRSAKELMRLNGTTKSPVANFLSETVAGTVTIRAFKVQERFMRRNFKLIDNNSGPFFHAFAANEWLIMRLEALSAAILCSAALIMILLPEGTINPGFVGLALSYGLSLNVSLVSSVQNQCNLENFAVSVERIKQYMHVPSEAPPVIEDRRPPPSWPTRGRIELHDLQVRYRLTSPLVLRGITCIFEAGQKVGVVGRTGSGKTTLIGSLFRLVEPSSGRIIIDGLDIGSIGLRDLRSRLSVIPQEPTLFRGTVRFNLDPLCQYSDEQIWMALDKCQLGYTMREKPEKLDAQVGDDGAKWSVGQRQLFCLGRALLKQSNILVLDEATASIDNATDAILQRLIREEFVGCTVITVAHRIPTVVDSDMVLSLKDGELVEFDKPAKLLEQSTSLFNKLVTEYWAHSSTASIRN